MTDLICRKTMMRCQTQGMCAPFGGCQPSVLADCKTTQSNSSAAPSPAGVDGLEVVAWATFNKDYKDSGQLHYTEREARKRIQFLEFIATCDAEPLCRLSDAQAIIDGLRGEVAALRKRAKTAEREACSALATYKGLEKVARVVSDNSDQVCGDLNVLRQQFDQQAQRIGELEGLLRHASKYIAPGAVLTLIKATLSAGKDGV